MSVRDRFVNSREPKKAEVIYDSANQELPFIVELKELWRYRDLLVQLIKRNIKTRYKRSVLGIFWTMLNP
ncbi:MAG: hypothetical protein IPJ07_01135 [Acidobacteria bacterium]|nr:hypothetical protein [Acidobacteriota bacterium]